MHCAVRSIVWEFGPKYGHIFYPSSLLDLQGKIAELDASGLARNYSFLISVEFFDDTWHLAFTVGHELSYLEFGYKRDSTANRGEGPFYLFNKEASQDGFVPIYYMASHSDIEYEKLLPKQQVLDAVYYFISNCRFPDYIVFDDAEVNNRFVERKK
jgi:hypothetical protein